MTFGRSVYALTPAIHQNSIRRWIKAVKRFTSETINCKHMIGMVVIAEGDEILVWAGQRYMRIGKDLQYFKGERAKRGRKLPRGFQRVTLIEVVAD